jgi:hypothetical protein
MRHLFWIPCVVVTLAAPCAVVHAGPYQFEFLAERPRFGIAFTNDVYKLPALNDGGTVALILPRAAPTPYDELIYTGTPGNLRPVEIPGLKTIGGVSINNPGRIAFVGYPEDKTRGVYSVAPGGPVTTIAPAIAFDDRYETAISDNGTVVVASDPGNGLPAWVAGSIYVGDGSSPAQSVFTAHSPFDQAPLRFSQLSRPRMNAAGDWVVQESGSFGASYIARHTNRGSTYSVLPVDSWIGFGPADVAKDGVVAFSGQRQTDPSSLLFLSRPGAGPERVPGSEGLAGTVALNDNGDIALLSGGSSEVQGAQLRLLRNGALEPVLAQGDPLLGSTVSTIGFDPKGFNNAGQFALLVGLADGRDVYVLASPVPEPAAAAAVGVLGGLVLLRRSRRRHA